MTTDSIIISSRFRGPTGSGNGGYVCGRLAQHLQGCASVRLKAPPPLETELRVEKSESNARLFHNTDLIAEAKVAELELIVPARPTFAEARQASKAYAGFKHHAFPQCFVCGPDRIHGDGLRIFPGSIGSQPIVAAPWIPDISLANGSEHIGLEFLWAALDCPGAFSIMPAPDSGKAIVLGELCARIDAAVQPNEKYVVLGWSLGIDGRKRYAGSAIISEEGDQVAVARATWIEVDAKAFGGQ